MVRKACWRRQRLFIAWSITASYHPEFADERSRDKLVFLQGRDIQVTITWSWSLLRFNAL
ncbi:MAG: hypothetical protein H6624_17660 [Bdellovibrionaceae bacterium]|nr:hypothetical protein [Pseudobdellovibrionaceae bacterium]